MGRVGRESRRNTGSFGGAELSRRALQGDQKSPGSVRQGATMTRVPVEVDGELVPHSGVRRDLLLDELADTHVDVHGLRRGQQVDVEGALRVAAQGGVVLKPAELLQSVRCKGVEVVCAADRSGGERELGGESGGER